MDNKKYLDKVIGSLVRGTKLDYENNRITFPFYTPTLHVSHPLPLHLTSFLSSFFISFPLSPSFSTYCKNTFGLIDDEIEYVWNEYREIIKDKINNGEQ